MNKRHPLEVKRNKLIQAWTDCRPGSPEAEEIKEEIDRLENEILALPPSIETVALQLRLLLELLEEDKDELTPAQLELTRAGAQNAEALRLQA